MSNNTPHTSEEVIEELFDEYYPVGTVKPKNSIDEQKAEFMTEVLKRRRNNFKAKLLTLLVAEKQEAYKKGYIDGGIGVLNG